MTSSFLKRSETARHIKASDARKVFVIFGGDTSERQVSLMSGTNVWLNLQGFNDVSGELPVAVCSVNSMTILKI